jgi:predicted nucleotide-binding protein
MTEQLTRPKSVLEDLLNRTITSGEELRREVPQKGRDASIDALEVWDQQALTLLEGAFTGPDPYRIYPREFQKPYFNGTSTFQGDKTRIAEGFDSRLAALRSIRDLLDLYEEPSDTILAGQEHPASRTSTTVFIVHGRSEGPKQQVARFLERATNAQPIILHEQPKLGRVIIETLERYAATAAFAIVLLTADDRGGLAGAQESQLRARQNVVFELGFFIGALGRSRVAVLYEEAVELPSDMNGILYTVLDSQGAWKLGLGRELRAAGFAVDLNLTI